jgi:RHS repeat-associated protein
MEECSIWQAGSSPYPEDGLGSIVAVSKYGGQVYESYRYDAFGRTTIFNAYDQPISYSTYMGTRIYGFTGREYDCETGLYYYRARYYNPAIGRFLQTDPIGYADSLNLYQYCGNNPVNFIDSLGLWKGPVHERLTRIAMQQAGFSKEDIDAAIKANLDVDRASNQLNDAAHSMQGNGTASGDLIRELMERARSAKTTGDKAAALDALGRALHTIQDRYAHKNTRGLGGWVEHAWGELPFTQGPDNPYKYNGYAYRNAYTATKNAIQQYMAE